MTHLADLQSHKANRDHTSASAAIQDLANCDAARQNLNQLYQSYVLSHQPPQPEELTDAERHSRPWHKMTPDDALALAITLRMTPR